MSEAKSTGLKSILIADDEQGFRDLFHFIFEPLGYEVVTVKDGQQALDAARDRSFDLVVLDVHMPRMGGPEALAALHDLRPDQRVIIVSSRFDPTASFEIEAVRAGVADCLFKPMEIDELIAAVEKALRQ